jgi:hypothetical protein
VSGSHKSFTFPTPHSTSQRSDFGAFFAGRECCEWRELLTSHNTRKDFSRSLARSINSHPHAQKYTDEPTHKHSCRSTTNNLTMFLPNTNAAAEKEAEKQMLTKIEGWGLGIISEDMRNDVELSVAEVQCGDPECSPIDTVVTIVFHR